MNNIKLILAILIFVGSSIKVYAEQKQEIIINGGFEGTFKEVKEHIAERWYVNPGGSSSEYQGAKIISDSTISHSGENCLYMESDPEIKGSVIAIMYTPYEKEPRAWVSFGEKYVFEVWAKAIKSNSGMYLCCYQYSENGTHFVKTVSEPLYPNPPFKLTDEWNKYIFKYTPISSEIDTVGIAIHIYGSGYIDDISFYHIEE